VDLDDTLCGACKLSVSDEDKAVCCDAFCDTWFHAKCVNISDKNYKSIRVLDDAVKWICDACSKRLECLKADLCSNDDHHWVLRNMINGLQDLVKSLISENLVIKSKLDIFFNRTVDPNLNLDNVAIDDKPEVQRQVGHVIAAKDSPQLSDYGLKNPDAKNSHQPGEPDSKDVQSTEQCDETVRENSPSVDGSRNIGSTPADDAWKTAVNRRKKKKNEDKTLYATSSYSGVVQNGGRDSVVDVRNLKSAASTGRKSYTVQGGSVNRSAQRLTGGRKKNGEVIVGSANEDGLLTGSKKAWYHLGKVKKGTSVQDVQSFLKKSFPDLEVLVDKLDSKGINDSFRLGVEFSKKDLILNSSMWPKNITLKRFLFLTNAKRAQLDS